MKKKQILHIRITDDEMEMLKDMAKRYAGGNLSDYVRECLFDEKVGVIRETSIGAQGVPSEKPQAVKEEDNDIIEPTYD